MTFNKSDVIYLQMRAADLSKEIKSLSKKRGNYGDFRERELSDMISYKRGQLDGLEAALITLLTGNWSNQI